MIGVKELDSIRTTVDVPAIFGDRTIPAGTRGAVVDVYPDGACVADFELEPQGDNAGFVQAELKPGQFEVIANE